MRKEADFFVLSQGEACTLIIDSADSEGGLPTSATCSNTLYLPKYRSVAVAVDRLRYAAYNCVAIDTDFNAVE